MSYPTLAAAPRTAFGTRAANRYRDQGQVPVAISRRGEDSLHVVLGLKEADTLAGLLSRIAVIDVDGAAHEVLVKRVERDPITDRVRHIDAIAVTDDQQVKVDVPVRANTVGVDCPGLKAGGLLEQMVRRVRIACRAADVPEAVDVDLNGVQLGQTVYAEQIDLPAGAKLLVQPRTAILTIVKTRGMRRAEAQAAGETPAEG